MYVCVQGCIHHHIIHRTFLLNRERAVDYLNMLDRVYVFDGFAGWDPASRIKIRVVCARVCVVHAGLSL